MASTMDDEAVAQFVSFTSSTAERAHQYLQLADGNVQQAINIFFTNDGNDPSGLSPSAQQQSSPLPPATSIETRSSRRERGYIDEDVIVHIDSDVENPENDVPHATRNQTQGSTTARSRSNVPTPSSSTPPSNAAANTVHEDEALARRLQEEFYTAGGVGGEVGPDGIRAPLERTTETLVGPNSLDTTNEEMRAAIQEQLRARQRTRPRERPGIFNQATTSSIWNEADDSPSAHRDRLARATAGASEASAKSNLLAEMYRPPFEIISRLSWEDARQQGKDNEKWIIVNIQDPAIFDCQVLNRDIWKNAGIMESIKEYFIFMQYAKNDPHGNQYIQYYFSNRESQDAYPHIAIVDPRTGEQVKVWSGPPVPNAMDFLMQLHEFLDRYSLKATAKNPVARRKPEARKETQVEKMSEEQMLEMALQNSLAGTEVSRDVDPDDLTRSVGNVERVTEAHEDDVEMSDNLESAHTNGDSMPTPPSPFASISSSHLHSEPPPDNSVTTRIQFRHPTGRVVRRFTLSDPVRRIYEWLKASPLEGKEGVEFELIYLQKNLVNQLEDSIEQAGLKNGTVMVEFLEG